MLNNEVRLTRQTLIDLNPNELHYYPFMNSLDMDIFFMGSLDRCDGSCNTLDDPFGRMSVPNKTEKIW